MSVNRTELIAAIAEKAGLTKTDADAFLGAFQDVLVENVAKGEAVKITGLMGTSASSVPHAPAVTPAPVRRSRSPPATVSRSPSAPR